MENSGAQGTSGTPHPRPAMNGWRILGWGLALALLLLPLIAMQFTAEVNWGPGDFLLMGAMLGGVGLTLEWVAMRQSPVKVSRNALFGTLIMLVGVFLMLWMNAAVGIVGDESNPVNRWFYGLAALVILGALALRFRPAPMVRWMVIVAGLQCLLFLALWGLGVAFTPMLSLAFAGIWLASAWQFIRAERGS